MSCQTLKEAIVEKARGGDLRPGTAAAVDSHVEHCASCSALLAREVQLSDGLRALAASGASQMPSEALEQRMMASFAEHLSKRSIAGHGARYRWMPAAAALILTTGAIAWWRPSNPALDDARRDKPSTTAVSNRSPAAAGTPAPEANPAARIADGTRNAGPAATAGRRPERPKPIRPEGFVALPAAAGLPDFESGEIVRVEIPLTSLPAYGIEILPDARSSPVEADLLLGQDGQARAIRLVTAAPRDFKSP
jgi:hypothetical protein